MSTSSKNEIALMRIVCGLVLTSLKNETRSTRIVPYLVSTSLKNENKDMRIVLGLMSASLKNETRVHEGSSLSCVNLVKEGNQWYEDSSFTVSASLKNEIGLRG